MTHLTPRCTALARFFLEDVRGLRDEDEVRRLTNSLQDLLESFPKNKWYPTDRETTMFMVGLFLGAFIGIEIWLLWKAVSSL